MLIMLPCVAAQGENSIRKKFLLVILEEWRGIKKTYKRHAWDQRNSRVSAQATQVYIEQTLRKKLTMMLEMTSENGRPIPLAELRAL